MNRADSFSTYGTSSVGRAPVSKTGCREFESLVPCQKHKHEKIKITYGYRGVLYRVAVQDFLANKDPGGEKRGDRAYRFHHYCSDHLLHG